MSELNCRWTGTETPRALVGRHDDECTDEWCKGCLRCPRHHCVICGIEHVDERTCPGCIGATRDDLAEIVTLYAELPHQAIAGGNDGMLEAAREIPGGESTVMLGPWAKRGETNRGDHMTTEHVLVTWEDDWRSTKHQPTDDLTSVAGAWVYLSEHLAWAAQKHDAFDAFATEIRQHRAHLEDVLYAGERVETGAPCEVCRTPLERVWAKDQSQDSYWCQRCKDSFSIGEYVQSVSRQARRHKGWLTSRDMWLEHDIPRGSLTSWASEGIVHKRKDVNLGRMVYNVKEACTKRDQDTRDQSA